MPIDKSKITPDSGEKAEESNKSKSILQPITREQTEAEMEKTKLLLISSKVQDVIDAAVSTPIEKVAPDEIVNRKLPDKVLFDIIASLMKTHGISGTIALISIYLLFLKGAANTGTPSNMEVHLVDQDGNPLVMTKGDLIYTYKKVTGNNFLRRLAESLSTEISTYAQKNGLKGDLASQINTRLVSRGEPILNENEQAWASSFCQNDPALEFKSSKKLAQCLAEDYNLRFDNRSKKGSNQPKGSSNKKEEGYRKPSSKGPKKPSDPNNPTKPYPKV